MAQGHLHLVLDLERVRHADQSGLDTLVGCLQTVRRAGGDLKLVGVTRRISARIVITGLLRVFDVHDTAQAAVRAFRRMRLLLGSIVA